MRCPECKSPIVNNATVCEWCGAPIPQKIIDSLSHDEDMFYENLFDLCKEGNISLAIKIYQEKTGESYDESKEYVDAIIDGIKGGNKIDPEPEPDPGSGKSCLWFVLFLLACLFAILYFNH